MENQNKTLSIQTKEHAVSNSKPQINFMNSRDLFGVSWLQLKKWAENSAYIIDMITDALCTEDFGKWCFGEDIRDDPRVKTNVYNTRSDKLAYDPIMKKIMIEKKSNELFLQEKEKFFQHIVYKIEKLQRQFLSLSWKKVISKKEVNADRKKIRNKINTEIWRHRRFIDQLDPWPPPNRKIIARRQEKIAELLRQKEEWLSALPTSTKQADTIENQREKIRKEITSLEQITQWRDNSSKFYKQLKNEYIKTLHNIWERMVMQEMYNEQEQQFQNRISKWVNDMQQRYKLPLEHQIPKSKMYIKTIEWAQNKVSKIEDLEEYFLSHIIELIQIQLLEDVLKEKYPEKHIHVYKAPAVDDITAKTDCFIQVDNKYIAIDLKTSINKIFIKDQKKRIEETKPLYATSHALAIDPKHIHNHIFSINPSMVYTLLGSLVRKIHTWDTLPKHISELADYLTYEKVREAITKEHKKEEQKKSYEDHTEKFTHDISTIIGEAA